MTTQENLEMIKQSAKDFAETYIRPHIMEWDEAQFFPIETMRALGQHGFLGVLVPEEYGGSGLGYQEYITVIEEITKVDSSIGLSVAAHNSLCTGHILAFGNEEQKRKYLPKLASGEWIGAWGLTEANTGSDAGRMQCVAVQDGDDYVINGTKNWITHGISGEVAVVIVRTGELLDSHGMTAFVVERGTPGFNAGKKENKLGMRASETAEMVFDNCRVHKSQMLGQVGEGFVQSMKVLDGGRISIAALSLGIAKGSYEASVKYAKERHQFGQAIVNFQAISFKLADMATRIEAAELLTRQAADLKNNGKKMTKEGAMAKYYASEVCVWAATEAIQIHGGYGYTKDFPVEKFFRDSKLCTIGEGTSEIQKIVIAREIIKNS
ncbi:MAG: acyl-CoA dehydrogenase family protein [Saprospiraceae bacterium]|jgi:alkylation response protein AidB-like acyl-CoA dehydrogenase|uniref:acyl-CoA dehydrogenase family protein n=1 Tax=Candidatus Brachybacter algidus TaxID=2982024 RepID=UPI001B6035DA|nr:acyl-CoA dehydrogenase family protein [Candidatus Brachybacter algidus]MBP7305047.1 acyl-CoA dehydrogenase family protein [Saprospiraceae bacterium]MBK6447789.1 acyl-CoA dehydrogenase family protein [Candidatus Brachybacter algidus]MBK7602600.1 acyl-CoA dehydrogenase family protein [Candidatus Brachybacter algidus]MBK8354738.1 acyl-CoA dehydrogenase family protein [Candidatus Brachybacter algidus]MBK8746828.1 acyl-CoA dehydrogenase family protein [Candidatus Brachybacter algidus]